MHLAGYKQLMKGNFPECIRYGWVGCVLKVVWFIFLTCPLEVMDIFGVWP